MIVMPTVALKLALIGNTTITVLRPNDRHADCGIETDANATEANANAGSE